jgi:hypothetical protein
MHGGSARAPTFSFPTAEKMKQPAPQPTGRTAGRRETAELPDTNRVMAYSRMETAADQQLQM